MLIDHAERISAAAYWELLVNLTKREVMGRYTQSIFGVGWAIAQPLATMAVFTFVFSRLAKIPSGGAPYPVFAYSALVPWFFFSNSVNSGTLSLITYRNIVTKTYFPREIIPFAQVCSRLLDFASAGALFALLMIYYRVGARALGAADAGVLPPAAALHHRRDAGDLVDQRFLSRREPGRADRPSVVALPHAGGVPAVGGLTEVPLAVRPEPPQRHRRGVPVGAGVRPRARLDA